MDTGVKSLRLGASSIADICGEGYNSRQKLWRIKSGREQREEPNGFMLLGQQNEHRAITAVECDAGLWFSHTSDDKDKQFQLRREYCGATLVMLLDGVVEDDGIALEVKCPQSLRSEVPLKYMIQMQTGFWLAGPWLKQFVYAEWSPAETRKWMVYPNIQFQDILARYVKSFIGYIQRDEQPPKWSSKANPKPVFPKCRTERV